MFSLQYGASMKCQTYGNRYQPMTAPTIIAASAFSTRLRSSRMCSISGIRPSGFTILAVREIRGPRVPAGCGAPSGVVMGWMGA